MSGTEIALALAKILPVEKVYDDLAAPAVRQVGMTLESAVKCLRLATFPLEYGSAQFERMQRFIRRSVDEVPEQNRIPPAPQILGPAVEGIRYEEEGSPIEEMFAQLLSRSMDSDRVNLAHPAYPALIRQLSPDEAEMLRIMWGSHQTGHFHQRNVRQSLKNNRFHFDRIELDDLPREALLYPENVDFYVDHLWNLGLAGLFEVRNQEHLYAGDVQVGVRVFRQYQLTAIGQHFATAVLKPVAGHPSA
ncbi:DUF4393 domain-containing protein [Rhizobium sp. WL3]|uniref:DUF4393 domain-containing protein n=1 Tax=Rhizobium sp. WL3 TaxID=2603277 RepID=UPI0011C1EA53|nr:DUF4393 domain-containing protein [Rhizobium sp. WL3]QEE47487.1 DUF4393 domain-containing protein [Rhizobium sp. WL3]